MLGVLGSIVLLVLLGFLGDQIAKTAPVHTHHTQYDRLIAMYGCAGINQLGLIGAIEEIAKREGKKMGMLVFLGLAVVATLAVGTSLVLIAQIFKIDL
ncbi:hypothetical protein [Helicobacter felis]|uniref:hypothetical protein n=1 Tax=Helicobacter felis TaxID=214 RepID=UPI0013CE3C6B|nr:hypothetical protein [Helicobacter felis]